MWFTCREITGAEWKLCAGVSQRATVDDLLERVACQQDEDPPASWLPGSVHSARHPRHPQKHHCWAATWDRWVTSVFRLDSSPIIWQPNASLPSTGKLVALKELNVSYNRLCRVPPELGNCEDLQRLELTGNHLCELPFEVRQTCWCPHGHSWLLLLW